jgi:tyrosinase
MRTSLFALAVAGSASALPQKDIVGGVVGGVTGLLGKIVPALPLHIFKETPKFVVPLTLEEARAGKNSTEDLEKPAFRKLAVAAAAATCSNPRVRTEWENYPDTDRQAFTSAVQCLMGRPPNGQFSQSRSRYEDMVALHQTLTPNVHGSAKFLIWHRYYLWTFEQLLRDECGFDRNFPWFDETKFAGRFAQSSIFSSQWFGSVNVGGNCVTDGVRSSDLSV